MLKSRCLGMNSFNLKNKLKTIFSTNAIKIKFSFSTLENLVNVKSNLNESLKNTNTEDFFQKHFKLNTPPENMYNDMDMSLASEIFNSIDLENLSTCPLISGRFTRFWCLTEDIMHHFVMFITHDMNLGIGTAIIGLAVFMRLLFVPISKKNNTIAQRSRLVFPEINEIQERIKILKTAGEKELLIVENRKLKQLRENFNFKSNPIIFLLSLAQGVVVGCWAGLVQRFSFNIEDYPEMINGGFLWFKDLSMTDPYFILPIINAILIEANLYMTNNAYSNNIMLKMRRWLFLPPILSLPIMCTLESGLLLYFTIFSFTQLLTMIYLNSESSKKKLGILNYLPGSKLEKINKFRLTNNKLEENILNTIQVNQESESNKINQKSNAQINKQTNIPEKNTVTSKKKKNLPVKK